jgi:hypothetical protein
MSCRFIAFEILLVELTSVSFSQDGLIPPHLCEPLQYFAFEPCGCNTVSGNERIPGTTRPPTTASPATPGPTPATPTKSPTLPPSAQPTTKPATPGSSPTPSSSSSAAPSPPLKQHRTPNDDGKDGIAKLSANGYGGAGGGGGIRRRHLKGA